MSAERELAEVLEHPLWPDLPGYVLRCVTSRERRLVCGRAVQMARPGNEWRMFTAVADA